MRPDRHELDAFYEGPLTADEFGRRLAQALAAMNGPEGAEMRELVDWFRRRYPTPLERLRYARRKYAEATRFRGVASRQTTMTR
jgi:hypothetical protein